MGTEKYFFLKQFLAYFYAEKSIYAEVQIKEPNPSS